MSRENLKDIKREIAEWHPEWSKERVAREALRELLRAAQ